MINIFYFDLDKFGFDEAREIYQNVKNALPEGDQLIGIPKGINIIQDVDISFLYYLRETVDEAIDEYYRKDD